MKMELKTIFVLVFLAALASGNEVRKINCKYIINFMRTNKFYWPHVLILDDKNIKLITRILRRRNVVLIRPQLPLLLISGFLLRETLQNLPYVIYIYYLYTKTQNDFVYFSFHPKYFFFILLNHFIGHKPWNWEERSLKYYLRLFCKLWSPQKYKQKKVWFPWRKENLSDCTLSHVIKKIYKYCLVRKKNPTCIIFRWPHWSIL